MLARDGPAQGAKLELTDHGYRITVDKLANAFSDEFVSLELRLEGMKRQGVDVHIMSLTTPMVYWASPAFGHALSQAYNDAASSAHLKYPSQLFAFAMVPMQDPQLALQELERAAKLPGLRGLYLATSVDGTELDDQRYWDIYAKCEAIGWPIFLHPVYTMGVERTKRSDYCFDMGLDDPVGTVERLGELPEAQRNLILGGTAAKLLGIA